MAEVTAIIRGLLTLQGTDHVGANQSCCCNSKSNEHISCSSSFNKNYSMNCATPSENGHAFPFLCHMFVQNNESCCKTSASYFHLTFTWIQKWYHQFFPFMKLLQVRFLTKTIHNSLKKEFTTYSLQALCAAFLFCSCSADVWLWALCKLSARLCG